MDAGQAFVRENMFCFALLPAKPLPALPVDIWQIHRGSCLTDAKVDVVLQGALASLSLHKYLCTETDKRVRMRATHTNTHTHHHHLQASTYKEVLFKAANFKQKQQLHIPLAVPARSRQCPHWTGFNP